MKMQLKKQNVTSKVSLSSILMNAYPRFNGSSDHEFYLAKLFRFFTWEAFKTLFAVKNEVMLE